LNRLRLLRRNYGRNCAALVVASISSLKRPLLVAQERNETLTKSLFANQKKIAKALRKQKVSLRFVQMF
jgi:hypothetical protein